MFDISFSEILVIAAVALVVLGPERLPKVARTLGHLIGRAQRYANDVKNDIQREMELEELRKWQNSVEGAARSVETTVRSEMGEFQEAIQVGPQRSAASPRDIDAAFEPPHDIPAGSPPKQDSPTEPVRPTSGSIQSKPDPTQP